MGRSVVTAGAKPMTATSAPEGDEPLLRFIEAMRVLIVGGIPAGVLLVGVGSRLAMLLLRVTSSSGVHGVVSDDGFVIGRVTVAGTYNLLLIGAGVGILGAVAYRVVAPWLIGPTWFRRVTTGAAAAAVVGSILIHSDGIDFTLLKPTWLAIALFIALPGVFGTFIGSCVDAVSQRDSWTSRGRRRWVLPLIAVACFPLTVPVLLFAAVILAVWSAARELEVVKRIRGARLYALAVRSLWLVIAMVGLVALINDTRALAATLG
jgi:hypothetical protein